MKCSICGDKIGNFEGITLDGKTYCLVCYDSVEGECSYCGCVINVRDSINMDGDLYCEDCVILCDYCDCPSLAEFSHKVGECTYCYRCFIRHVSECISCHETFLDEHLSEDGYCINCRDNKIIQEYSYKPDPKFFGEGPLFLGVELEIDQGDYPEKTAQAMEDTASGLLYFKEDSSLDSGFEIVSHPMSLEYHIKEAPWDKVLEIAKSSNYTSHNAGTCGLHVHVSREAFSDLDIMNLLMFTELQWEFLKIFSRRDASRLSRWADRYGLSGVETGEELLTKAKNSGRYRAINLSNFYTIEFRMFRGTLNPVTFKATLQLVHEMCKFVIGKSLEDVRNTSWNDFVASIKRYPELDEYLKIRKLDHIDEDILKCQLSDTLFVEVEVCEFI